MLGAIAGDIIGSVWESAQIKTPQFYPLFSPQCRPTDDSVLTVALADSILTGADFTDKLKEYFRLYPHAGYGGTFYRWAQSISRRLTDFLPICARQGTGPWGSYSMRWACCPRARRPRNPGARSLLLCGGNAPDRRTHSGIFP